MVHLKMDSITVWIRETLITLSLGWIVSRSLTSTTALILQEVAATITSSVLYVLHKQDIVVFVNDSIIGVNNMLEV